MNLSREQYGRDLLYKAVIWTIPGRLITGWIISLTWWNIFIPIAINIAHSKWWYDLSYLSTIPNWIGVFLVITGSYLYIYHQKTNIPITSNTSLKGLEYAFHDLICEGILEKTIWEASIQWKQANKFKLDKVIQKHKKEAIELANFIDGNWWYIMQVIGWDIEYVYRFLIAFCNIEGKQRQWIIIDTMNIEDTSIIDISRENYLEVVILSKINCWDKLWWLLDRWRNKLIVYWTTKDMSIQNTIEVNEERIPEWLELYNN